MSKTLDRTRPFGTVQNDPDRGYHQDGMYFDHAGNAVGQPAAAKEPAKAKPAKAAAGDDELGTFNADGETGADALQALKPKFDEMDRDELKEWLVGQNVEFKGNISNAKLLELAERTFAEAA
jgi:hypothetical protein